MFPTPDLNNRARSLVEEGVSDFYQLQFAASSNQACTFENFSSEATEEVRIEAGRAKHGRQRTNQAESKEFKKEKPSRTDQLLWLTLSESVKMLGLLQLPAALNSRPWYGHLMHLPSFTVPTSEPIARDAPRCGHASGTAATSSGRGRQST